MDCLSTCLLSINLLNYFRVEGIYLTLLPISLKIKGTLLHYYLWLHVTKLTFPYYLVIHNIFKYSHFSQQYILQFFFKKNGEIMWLFMHPSLWSDIQTFSSPFSLHWKWRRGEAWERKVEMVYEKVFCMWCFFKCNYCLHIPYSSLFTF